MTMDILVDQFPDYLRIERGLADNTVEAYGRDLVGFSRFLEGRKCSPLEVSGDRIEEYLGLLGRALSRRSVARNISTIKTFFRFLVSQGKIETNPARLVEAPRLSRRLPDILSQREVERLISMPDASHPRGQRDLAMLELLYATGLRVSELSFFKSKGSPHDPTGVLENHKEVWAGGRYQEKDNASRVEAFFCQSSPGGWR